MTVEEECRAVAIALKATHDVPAARRYFGHLHRKTPGPQPPCGQLRNLGLSRPRFFDLGIHGWSGDQGTSEGHRVTRPGILQSPALFLCHAPPPDASYTTDGGGPGSSGQPRADRGKTNQPAPLARTGLIRLFAYVETSVSGTLCASGAV